MNEDLQERRLDYLRRHGYYGDHLATFVEDQKCQAANAINNKGIEVQLEYLMKCMTWSELVEALQVQRKLLESHGRHIESKCRPEKNR